MRNGGGRLWERPAPSARADKTGEGVPQRSTSWLLTGIFLLTACAPGTAVPGQGQSSGAQSSAPKRLVAAVRSSPNVVFYSKVNLASAGLGTNDFQQVLNAGLVAPDLAGVQSPQLAEEVPTLDNHRWTLLPDGRMETSWTIKSGAAWHDGTPFTTDDLVFTAAMASDKSLPLFKDIAFDSVQSVKAVDARTLTITWLRPYTEADSMFSYAHALPLPKHILEKPYQEDKENLLQQPYWSQEFVGTGAFKLREFMPDSHLLFAANEGYVQGRPGIDSIEVRPFPDPNTILANMLAGEIEYVFDARSISLEQGVQLRDQWRYGKLELAPGSFVTIYPQFLDPDPAIVANPQFRRALIQGTDRQAMADSLEYGLTTVADIWMDQSRLEYQAIKGDVVRWPFDPANAAKLIEGLGYAKAADGKFANPSGQPLAVELRTSVTDINVKSTAAVADYWQQLGAGVSQEIVAPQRAQDRPYRATFPAFELIRPGNMVTVFQQWRSTTIPTAETNWVGDNRSRYRNPELDALIDQYFVTIPVDERNRILGKVVHLFSNDQVWMALFYDPSVVAIGSRLHKVVPGSLRNVHEWALTN